MRTFPALDIVWPTAPDDDLLERLIAELHDTRLTAVEDRSNGVRVFFVDADDCARARDIVSAFDATARAEAMLVPDEAWAERSQAALTAVDVGRFIVAPPWVAIPAMADDRILITIQPSMGFGTGHHATTRLCLHLLQDQALRNAMALDVGTGSGVLALAAWCLGAPHVVAIDSDPDAIASAAENVELNQARGHVELQLLDLAHAHGYFMQHFDVVTANLTGGMLMRFAPELSAHVARRGVLIVSGFQTDEELAVQTAFADDGFRTARRVEETGWVALALTRGRST